MSVLTSATEPPLSNGRRGHALPLVALALGFGAGANLAVGGVVGAVLAASRTAAPDLTSAALRASADGGLALATGLATVLLVCLAGLAGHCAVHGRPSGRTCRIAVPGAAGASAGLVAGAWLMALVLGFAEGGAPHTLDLLASGQAAALVAAFAAGAGWRLALAAPQRLAEALTRLRPAGRWAAAASRPARLAVATFAIAILTVCGLVLGWTSSGRPQGLAGARPETPATGDCPGRTAVKVSADCGRGVSCPQPPRTEPMS